jgi:glyoxylase-like metal-dependent hydrolase (beta-lactamase superfamily II)
MLDFEITPLELARVQLPDFHPAAPGIDTIHGFLVRDAEACVLVDTGVGVGSDGIDSLYRPERADLPAALRAAGTPVSEITAIVNSHLHFDHCGNNALFPGLPIYVQETELEASRAAHYTVPEWVGFEGASYVPVSGRRRISRCLELEPTPGHTPGHQSLVARSGEHVEIVVAQAAYSASEFQLFAGGLPRREADGDAAVQTCLRSNATWSADAYLDSVAKLHGMRPRKAYFSHDAKVWAPTGG